MLLTITTTHSPATDLGYLLHKHPAKVQTFKVSFGQVHVFYPEATAERCTAALLLDVDPIQLVRKKRGEGGFALQQYVNDRPYVASSFLSTAIAKVYRSALNALCKERAALAQSAIPLHVKIAVLPCYGGEFFLRRLFEPLGYTVRAQAHILDEGFPEWGESPYFTVELEHTLPLWQLLTHLYVLIPVLDDQKHYWVGEEEIEKLLRRGGEWLASHPEREHITQRYLKHRLPLTRAALAQLGEEDDEPLSETTEARHDAQIRSTERPGGLHEQRLQAVLAVLRARQASRVLDLGCGEGKLLRLLLRDKGFSEIVGLDVSYRRLEYAAKALHLDNLPDRQRQRLKLMQGSLIYRDERLAGYDAAAVVEVIEHLDAPRLAAFERVVFEFAQPKTIIITTPNREYNVMWPSLPVGKLRHRDHRFEWTRAEFKKWAKRMAAQYGYSVSFEGIGPQDKKVGTPTQMGVFTR